MGKKKQTHQSIDRILEINARKINLSFPTQPATLEIGEKEITNAPTEGEANLTISLHKSSSLTNHINHFFISRNPTTEDRQPTSKSEHKAGSGSISDKGKKRKDLKSKPDSDNDQKVVPRREELHLQDEVFEENDHSAQVEGLPQSTSSPPKFDGISDLPKFLGISDMPTTKSGDPGSNSPRKDQKDGFREIRKRRMGNTAGNKEETSSASRRTSTRAFTEDDEIILLQGTVDCGLLHNVPASSVSASVLHELLDGILHSDFNKTQIYDKMRRLKKKFVKNMKMFQSSGSDFSVLLDPHEAIAFELSKKIWGGRNGDHKNPNGSDQHVQNRTVVEDSGDLDVKGKRKIIKGKKILTGGFCAKVADAALDTLKDGEVHDYIGETKVQNGNDEDENPKVSMNKRRLLEEIDNVTKKIRLMLELAKLEVNELKKG